MTTQDAKSTRKMLEGIRIADLTTVVFGPYCTQILSDLGAEIIKVEPPEGDSSRIMGKPSVTPLMAPIHLRLNRGKKCVDWNLRTEAGQAAIKRLIETSDVFIHNVRADAIARINLSYENVRAIRPDIIYVHCTGFDQRGPYASLQAYDDIIQAASGMATLLPSVDGNPAPRFIPTMMADKASSLHAGYAVLAALIHKVRTGEGQLVEVPMFESAVSFNLTEHLFNESLSSDGIANEKKHFSKFRRPFRTLDGYIAVALDCEDQWTHFFNVLGRRGDAIQTPAIGTQEIYEAATEVMQTRPTSDWLATLSKANIPAVRFNDMNEVVYDQQVLAAGILRPRTHPTEGPYLEVGPPVQFSAYPYFERAHASEIGAHSDEVATELGISVTRVDGRL